MGREVRRVSANWQHPKNDKDEFIPMNRGDFGGGFAKMEAEWNDGREKWLPGEEYKWREWARAYALRALRERA